MYNFYFYLFRSNASTNGNSSTNSSSGSSEQGRFFYSLYDFEATDTTMISTQRGQVVRVVSTIFHLHTYFYKTVVIIFLFEFGEHFHNRLLYGAVLQ